SHAYLDYDDIILYTVNLLHKKDAAAWVLYKLDGGIDHILIDEAQDTAPEQWQLVNALTSEFFNSNSSLELLLKPPS
ncbi:MAG: UvrD-helicase domain-containing protein, partial [Pseudomonadota bacterium]